jgi:UDPglucose--hexose-1-phosphate uridylyltransferase
VSAFRRDPLNGGWVIIATERGKRPSDFGSVRSERSTGPCVFCTGREWETPPEVMAYRSPDSQPDGPGWQIRVVPNKFAAVGPDERLVRQDDALFASMSGVGMHEVVIETPEHDAHLCDLSVEHITDVLAAYRDRARAMMDDQRIQYVQIFKNWGSVAGASLEHSHAQIIALPIVPRYVHEQLSAARAHRELTGRCLICDIVREELVRQERVVSVTPDFVAIAPYASRFPFEVHIYPRRHESDFVGASDPLLESMARMLKEVLFGLRIALLDPPFNFMIRTRPRVVSGERLGGGDKFHWHLEIIPRLTQVAGFEWGTGFYINPTPPEQAAQFLRDVLLPVYMVESGRGGI